MPDQAAHTPKESTMQKDLRPRLKNQLSELQKTAHKAVSFNRELKIVREKSERWLELHREELEEASGNRAMHLVSLLLPLSVYCLDVTFLNPVVDYLVSDLLGEGTLVAEASHYIIPGVILWFEMWMGLKVHSTQKDLENGKRAGTARLWQTGAVLYVLFLAILIGGAFFAGGGLMTSFGALGVAVTGVSLLLHMAVVFGASAFHDALKIRALQKKDKQFADSMRDLRKHFMDARLDATEQLNEYLEAIRKYNSSPTGTQYVASPMDVVTRRFLNKVFGYEVIPAPAGAADDAGPGTDDKYGTDDAAPAVPEPVPPITGPIAGSGDNKVPAQEDLSGIDEEEGDLAAYYKSIVEQRVRDADDEVSI